MNIRDHLLDADGVEQRETPNRGGPITPRFLVFHYTSGGSAKSSVEWLCNPDAKASAHLVVARNGRVIQLAPFNIKTWHAGKSNWQGFSGLNAHSIGIEMDNAGILTEVGSSYRSWFQKEYPENEVVYARHKHEREASFWHAYSPEQIEMALDLALLLVREYELRDIVGHDDIAPGRKKNPARFFPLENIRARALGRSEEQEPRYEVTAQKLNIRNGPGVEYETVSDPLAEGTRVVLLESLDRWSKVEVEAENDLEGWVFNKYIRPL